MSWWRCHLCDRRERVDNPGDKWFQHYLAEHYNGVFSQITPRMETPNLGYNEVPPRAANSGGVTDPLVEKRTI